MKVFDLIIKQYNNEDMPKHIKINRETHQEYIPLYYV